MGVVYRARVGYGVDLGSVQWADDDDPDELVKLHGCVVHGYGTTWSESGRYVLLFTQTVKRVSTLGAEGAGPKPVLFASTGTDDLARGYLLAAWRALGFEDEMPPPAWLLTMEAC